MFSVCCEYERLFFEAMRSLPLDIPQPLQRTLDQLKGGANRAKLEPADAVLSARQLGQLGDVLFDPATDGETRVKLLDWHARHHDTLRKRFSYAVVRPA